MATKAEISWKRVNEDGEKIQVGKPNIKGARVTAVDIDAPALEVARERCRIHGVTVDIREANAKQLLGFGPMDAVLYFAALEHMTQEERLQSLAEAWSILPAGGLLAIIETPNRLWFFDHHTSRLPF